MSRLLRRKSGFTLIELLVVLAIASIVTSIATVALFRITSLWSDTSQKNELDESVNDFFVEFEGAIGSIIPPNLSGTSIVGIPQEPTSSYAGDADSIEFPARVYNTLANLLYPKRVTFKLLTRPNGLANLVRSELPLQSAAKTRPDEVVLLSGVTSLRIDYVGRDGSLERAWNSPELPDAVRVSVVLTDPASPRSQIVRTAEFPVRVQPNTRGQWGNIISEK